MVGYGLKITHIVLLFCYSIVDIKFFYVTSERFPFLVLFNFARVNMVNIWEKIVYPEY